MIKFCRMLSSSNPTVIEWLISDIVYYGTQPTALRKFAEQNFSRKSLYYHYKSMCRQNYLKYLKSRDEVTYKKYLYAMRGLLNAKWIAKMKSVPPINFNHTIRKLYLTKTISKSVYDLLADIILKKKDRKEKEIIQNLAEVDEYIENNLKDDSDAPSEKQMATYNEINKEMQKILLEKWKGRR